MKIATIQGEEAINKLCNHTMHSTLIALKQSGVITTEQESKFLDEHIAVFVGNDEQDGFIWWLKRIFGKNPSSMVVVCKTYTGETKKDKQ